MQSGKSREEQIRIFGDSAYKIQSHIFSYITGENVANTSKLYNYAMKSVRISIEWNYGFTASLFKYFLQEHKLRLMKSERVTKVYIVATLFRNFHVFNLMEQYPNFLEKYIKQDYW